MNEQAHRVPAEAFRDEAAYKRRLASVLCAQVCGHGGGNECVWLNPNQKCQQPKEAALGEKETNSKIHTAIQNSKCKLKSRGTQTQSSTYRLRPPRWCIRPWQVSPPNKSSKSDYNGGYFFFNSILGGGLCRILPGAGRAALAQKVLPLAAFAPSLLCVLRQLIFPVSHESIPANTSQGQQHHRAVALPGRGPQGPHSRKAA